MSLPEQVIRKLRDIEAKMKRIGFWDANLDEAAARSTATKFANEHGKSPVGNMNFKHWLQAVFIPNARTAAESNSLPESSNVAAMAMREYDYHSHSPEAEELLTLLSEFDQLFRHRAATLTTPGNDLTDGRKSWWKFW